MTTEAQNLAQQVREQTHDLVQQFQEQVLKEQALKSAQDFYANSLGSLKSRLENDRSQLEDLMRQLPGFGLDARTRIEELVASYKSIENSLDEATQQHRAEEAVGRAQKTMRQEATQRVARQPATKAWEAAAAEQETLEAEIEEDEIRIPVIEEEIVVEKRPVVKEEIRVHKKIVEEEEVVEEDVRREEVDIDKQTKRNNA